MTLELILIIISLLVLFAIYFSRIRWGGQKTSLFSEKFLNKADEVIFDFIKFIFKLYSLLFHNISTFLNKIPHKVITHVHRISHAVAQKSNLWVEKITHKTVK